MAYGYIPSPFGGRPPSSDIAKASTRNANKDMEVGRARKTPTSRANHQDNERAETRLDAMERAEAKHDSIGPSNKMRHAMKTPDARASNQAEENLHDAPIRQKDWDQHESLYKSEDESIDKANLNEELKYTGKKINHGNPKEKPWGKRRTDEEREAYYEEHPEVFDGEDFDIYGGESFDKARRGAERYAMRTPYGRARAAEGHYESTPDVPREESRLLTKEEWDDVDYYDTSVMPRFKDDAYRDLQNADTGFWTPDELIEQQNRNHLTDLSATTPKGRERSQRIAGGNVDRTGYEAIPGDNQVYHSTYEGDEIVAKSESAPIHKSIQTPIRDLIKEHRYWK